MRIPEAPLKEDTGNQQSDDTLNETTEKLSDSTTSNESTVSNVASNFITAVAHLTVQTVTSKEVYEEIGSAYTPQIDDDSYVVLCHSIPVKSNRPLF